MKSLIFSIYRHGGAGLSNLVMSLELGVVMAKLTGRLLVLSGNKTPVANIVQYGGLVSNAYPSRVTDLIDPGLAWVDEENFNTGHFSPHVISPHRAYQSVCRFPSHLSPQTDDFRAFKGNREFDFTIEAALENVPTLAYHGGPGADTLGYYSSFFYLDEASQALAYDALRNMRPKPELKHFADKIAADLGAFNAVHVRRGDFKKTRGVTTLDRRAAEAIEAMDHHFSRQDRLMIVTDEANDPFFDEIKAAYDDLIFIDHHILEHYRTEFFDLPAHDSLSLAYLSQLAAAHSVDFIGTMNSTFTGLIQRMRANGGKSEPFKYLWNELPLPGQTVEPGRHKANESVPLKKGVMVEQFEGPYSWNRYNQRLNQAWMREWPEAILNESEMLARTQQRKYRVAGDQADADRNHTLVGFKGSAVKASASRADVSQAIARLFRLMAFPNAQELIGEVRLEEERGVARLLVNGRETNRSDDSFKLLRLLYREVARMFIYQHPALFWVHAGCVAKAHGGVLLPGSWGRGKSTLAMELYRQGWAFLSDDIVPIDPETGAAMPFPGTPQVRQSTDKILQRPQISSLPKQAIALDPDKVSETPQKITDIVFPLFEPGAATQLAALSPANAVGELIENSLSFRVNPDETVQGLCNLVETLKPYRLIYSDPVDAAKTIVDMHDRHQGVKGDNSIVATS